MRDSVIRKLLTAFLVLAMIFSVTGCGKTQETGDRTGLGTSGFSIVLPEGFAAEEDDWEEDQVAYYYKDDESIDFDVYQWAKEGIYELEEEAAYFAAEYGTTAESVEINGIPGMKYISTEEYEGYDYTVINYMFDDGEFIVELCFWTINTQEELAVVEEIINTITAEKNLSK